MSDILQSSNPLRIGSFSAKNEFRVYHNIAGNTKLVAEIDSEGILRVKTDPTDEAAQKFVEAIERTINRKLTGIKNSDPT